MVSHFLATTPLPPCPPISVNSSTSTLLYINGTGTTDYTCYAVAWQALVTKSVNLTFRFRHDPDFWYLDDVSVYQGPTSIIHNGDFETGSLSSWATSFTTQCQFLGYSINVSLSSPRSGRFSARDGCHGAMDNLSQRFNALAGQIYVVSFWLKTNETGPGVIANVTVSWALSSIKILGLSEDWCSLFNQVAPHTLPSFRIRLGLTIDRWNIDCSRENEFLMKLTSLTYWWPL